MGFRKISTDIKECALILAELGWTLEAIQEALGVSSSSFYRWRKEFKTRGTINTLPTARGPSRTLTRPILNAVLQELQKNPDLYLDEIILWLALTHDVATSRATLSSSLHDMGYSNKRLHKLAIERDEELRSEWRDTIQSGQFERDGSQFIFIDETSKNERTWARKSGWAPVGQRAELHDVFVRGDRYSLVAAISTSGYIAAHVLPGSLDSMQFYEFIQEQVVSLTIY